MSATPVKGMDLKSVLQDLKTNRRVQVALVLLVITVWFLWPASAPVTARDTSARRASTPLGDRQTRELQKLPDLAKLDKAGELPGEGRMLRDLFVFDGPPPPPPPPVKPPPPPPPPTEAEKAAQALAAERAAQASSKPANLRYLGYLGTKSSGRLGAFMKGDEPVTYKQGDLVGPQWRLVKLTDASAEFQNLKFGDLKHRIDAIELKAGAGNAPANQF